MITEAATVLIKLIVLKIRNFNIEWSFLPYSKYNIFTRSPLLFEKSLRSDANLEPTVKKEARTRVKICF